VSFDRLVLRHGDLAFSALDSGAGPVVLCLHGFPDRRESWRFQLPALADAGFRAVAPSLRGYEPSSQPRDGDYHLVRMAEDVIAWIDQLEQDQVHLVGHDWGALIGYATAALAPERLRSLTTLAIPHPGQMRRAGFRQVPGQLRNSWYIFFFQLRVLADLAVEARDWAFIEKLWRDWSPGWELPADELRAVKDSLSRPGVKRAALAYYRATFDFWSEANRQTSRLLESEMRVPTLGLTGALDGCMDTRMHDLAMSKQDFPAGLEVVRIEQAGHFLHQERPDEVNRILLDWLTRSEAAAPESTDRDTNGGGR
jgi:pimeloyl-ACP methyl ester carboxylesterase